MVSSGRAPGLEFWTSRSGVAATAKGSLALALELWMVGSLGRWAACEGMVVLLRDSRL